MVMSLDVYSTHSSPLLAIYILLRGRNLQITRIESDMVVDFK